jgi:hypothetical protein
VREGYQVGIRKHRALDSHFVDPSQALDEPSLAFGGELAVAEAGDVEAVEKRHSPLACA